MKGNILVVVDVQNDFVSGALGSPEAQAMLPRLVTMLNTFDGDICFTMDTHHDDYMNTREGQLLPVPHCLEGTWGWQLVPELEHLRAERERMGRPCPVYGKETFGCVRLGQDLAELAGRGLITSVGLVGLCTDICVVSNALLVRSFVPQLPVTVDASCCAGSTPERHIEALHVMASCHITIQDGGTE